MTTAAPHTPTATTAGVTLRDRAREAVRDEVLIRAWLLFAEQGFTATTVEQIAEAAGMSRRTFFRYFNGKHELVAAALRSSGDQVAAALQARPATECAWHALRAAFDALITDVEGHDDLARSLHRMLQQEPEVRAASYERSHRWLDRLEPLIAQRLANTQPDPAATTTTDLATTNNLRARALIGSAIACFDAAQLTWAAHPGQSLAPLVDQAMQTLAPIR